MNTLDAMMLKRPCENRSLSHSYDKESGVLTIGDRTFTDQWEAEKYLGTVARTDIGNPEAW